MLIAQVLIELNMKLKIRIAKQRKGIRVIDDTNKNTFQIMRNLKILKIHLYYVLSFIFRAKNDTIPTVFNKKVWIIDHIYLIRYSQKNFVQSLIKHEQTKYAIYIRGPRFWNNKLQTNHKSLTSKALFKGKIKELLLTLDTEVQYF